MRRIRYFINGFPFQYKIFKNNLPSFDFDYFGPNIINDGYTGPTIQIESGDTYKFLKGYEYIYKNFFQLRKLYKTGEIQKYDIVHFNNTENFLNFRKLPHQISIAESHGFDFGVNYARFLQDEKNIFNKRLGRLIDKLLGARIRKKIQEFDIYYCSTPDMLEPLQKLVRKDVKWLPNPINIEIFKPEGYTIKLEGNPACFFPTRLHGDKKPEIAIDIFQNIIKKKFPGATLHLLNQGFEVDKYKKLFHDKKTYFWHDFMDKETLASKIRGSDLCFGDFSIGGLSLMPMQIMACKKPIITFDKHEIVKKEIHELPAYAQRLIDDLDFAQKEVEKHYDYIMHNHTEESICKIHLENIRRIAKEKSLDFDL